MITLRINVDNINTVLNVYNQVEIQRAPTQAGTFTTISGLGPIDLYPDTSSYSVIDNSGESSYWYSTRYICSAIGVNTTCKDAGGTGNYSAWSEPVLGDAGDLFYNPLFPKEMSYGTNDQQIIQRIRIYIGDSIGLRREYGENAASSIHPDGKTYELDEKGWPVSVFMNGVSKNDTSLVSVNGYRYLRFSDYIDVETTITGSESIPCSPVYYTQGVDIWYYTFRNSDRQIMAAYDMCPIPPGLTASNVTVESYVLQTAINLLYQENWEDAVEDGAVVTDEQSRYDPSPGLRFRDALLDKLNKKLDDLVHGLTLRGIEGVLID